MSTAHEKLIIAAIDRHRKECSIFHSEDRVTRSATGARLTADRPVDSAQSYVKNTSRYFLDAILISRNILKLVFYTLEKKAITASKEKFLSTKEFLRVRGFIHLCESFIYTIAP